MQHGKKMEKKSERFSVLNVSREIFRAEELNAPQSKTVTNTKSCHQEALFAGQSYPPRTRQIRDEDRHPQKVVAFKDQLWDQNHPTSVPCRKPVPHPSPSCRRQAGQGSPATLTTTEGTVL
ncbi:hypothetical protein HPG69_007767 [Diceros bicornis minor]|uniref:Uncharacterized protein n=1 Tax=Diceros bicornis minor TaxID=77932 RepID=A0A7J7EAP9_DICBM|nr:hypothetical protein HPG69_007767 [Diceros bicornis minor]